MTGFVVKVCSKNPNAPDLQGKAIKYFLRTLSDGKTRAHGASNLFFTALRAGINLNEHYPRNPRRLSGTAFLFAFWIKHGEDYRTVIGDSRLYEVAAHEIKALGCPSTLEEVRKWVHQEGEKLHQSVRLCHEMIKLDLQLFNRADDFEGIATATLISHAALRKESTDNNVPKLSVWDAIALHKTMKKSPGFADSFFKQAAQEVFPLAPYFK